MADHLIVISVDALVYEDLTLLGSLPNVKSLLGRGSLVKRVRTLYPSLTHVIHTCLMTGARPDRTGVPANDHFTPGDICCPWYNNLDEVKCDTLFHAAKRAGMTTAASRWPLTAGGTEYIDYLIPEIMDEDLRREPDLLKLHKEMCSPILFEDVIRPNISILDWSHGKHPTDEEFQIRCAADIIRKFRPNLLMTHPSMVDSVRHGNGLWGEKVDEALRMTDRWIGEFLSAVRDAGIEDSTDIAVVSDHGHMQCVRTISLNVLFRKLGWIKTDPENRLLSYKVYTKACGLSAEIYVADPSDEPMVLKELQQMRDEGIYGFSKVLTAAETKERYGLDGDFSFVVETDGYTSFDEMWYGPVVKPMDDTDYACGHSNHGHMPERGPKPPMIVCGPDFRRGIILETGEITDEAPTFARALGITLKDACGKPIEEVFVR